MFSTTKKNKVCGTQDACTNLAYKAGHKLRETIDRAEDETRDATATLVKEVRKHPVKSGAIAAGAGFLLGLLLRRR